MGDSDGENIGLSEGINSKDAGNDRKEIEAKILELKKGKKAKKTATTKVLGKIVCCTERGERRRNREEYRGTLGTVRGNFEHY